jgi:hypothetical protein
MDKPQVDPKRTCPATLFDWKENGYPEYGEPGSGSAYANGEVYLFACPGCGRFSGIDVGHPKPPQSPSWDIVAGSLDDPSTLTLHPSINCVGCCKWHGWLKGGVFRPC